MSEMTKFNEESLIAALHALPELDPPPRVWHEVKRQIRPRWFAPSPLLTTSLAATVLAAAVLPMALLSPIPQGTDEGTAQFVELDEVSQRSLELQQSLETTPRIASREDTVQVALSQRIATIDRDLKSATEPDLAERMRLLQQRNALMQAYLQRQRERDSNLLMRASY